MSQERVLGDDYEEPSWDLDEYLSLDIHRKFLIRLSRDEDKSRTEDDLRAAVDASQQYWGRVSPQRYHHGVEQLWKTFTFHKPLEALTVLQKAKVV